jgi:predicted RNase H-like nuclease (RuvC/YqgF family)
VSLLSDLAHFAEITRLEDKIEELESRIEDLEDENESRGDEISDLESEVETLSGEVSERDRLLDKAYRLVQGAIDDLNALDEVPLRDVVACVEAVVENLRAVLA